MKMLKGLSTELRSLNQDQLSFYHDNGYLIVDNVFSHQECDEIYRLFKEKADDDFSAILNLDREVEELRSVMVAPKIVSIVEGLQGGECAALATQMLFKEAGSGYASQAWTPHQDNAYHQNPNGATMTLNIFCNDMDVENGAIFVWAGSHKEGLMECEQRASYREEVDSEPGNTVVVPEQYERVVLTISKGALMILHGNCIHGSYPNVSATRSRPMYSITYITKGESFAIGRNAKRMEIALR
jgi:phytanoyl-CoA hydroxylase